MQNIVEIRHLTKSYGDFILRDVNLDIKSGVITGLVGANGAGKSTLLKLILGLLSPDKGKILIFGQDAWSENIAFRQQIGFVQESPMLYPHLNVKELGNMMAFFYPAWNKATFKRLCSLLELPQKTPFKKMSRGTRMKTAIVLALSHDADILLLDEPTSGLDPLVRREVLDLLLDVVRDNNKAVFFSTHITSDLDRVADHVAIIKRGNLVLSGTKDQLMESWVLVKGGEQQVLRPLREICYGMERNGPDLTMLCEYSAIHNQILPDDLIMESPNLEDLVYFYGREPEDAACFH